MSFIVNIIDRTNIADRAANVCLSPLHGLLHVARRSVRVFQVDLRAAGLTATGEKIKTPLGKVVELSYEPLPKKTLFKITCIFLFVLFSIPGTVLGVCLKGVAYLDSSFREKINLISLFNIRYNLSNREIGVQTFFNPIEKMQRQKKESAREDQGIAAIPTTLLIRSSETHKLEPMQKPLSDRIATVATTKTYSDSLNDIVHYILFPYLGLIEVAKLKSINSFYFKQITYNLKFSNLYKTKLPPLSGIQIDSSYSFDQIVTHYQRFVQQYHYTSELIKWFDGVENILKLPLYTIQLSDKTWRAIFKATEKFAHSKEFGTTSDILRLTFEHTGFQEEVILVKYSLLVPKHAVSDWDESRQEWYRTTYDREACGIGSHGFPDTGSSNALRCGSWKELYGIQGDIVWHDYLLVKHAFMYYNSVTGNFTETWQILDPRQRMHAPFGCQRSLPFPHRYPALGVKTLRKLLKKQPSGLFGDGRRDASDHVPNCVYQKEKQYDAYARVFTDFPVVLGHVPIEEMFKVLRLSTLKRGAHLISLADEAHSAPL